MGRKIVAVAVLLAISVKAAIINETMSAIAYDGRKSRTMN